MHSSPMVATTRDRQDSGCRSDAGRKVSCGVIPRGARSARRSSGSSSRRSRSMPSSRTTCRYEKGDDERASEQTRRPANTRRALTFAGRRLLRAPRRDEHGAEHQRRVSQAVITERSGVREREGHARPRRGLRDRARSVAAGCGERVSGEIDVPRDGLAYFDMDAIGGELRRQRVHGAVDRAAVCRPWRFRKRTRRVEWPIATSRSDKACAEPRRRTNFR